MPEAFFGILSQILIKCLAKIISLFYHNSIQRIVIFCLKQHGQDFFVINLMKIYLFIGLLTFNLVFIDNTTISIDFRAIKLNKTGWETLKTLLIILLSKTLFRAILFMIDPMIVMRICIVYLMMISLRVFIRYVYGYASFYLQFFIVLSMVCLFDSWKFWLNFLLFLSLNIVLAKRLLTFN